MAHLSLPVVVFVGILACKGESTEACDPSTEVCDMDGDGVDSSEDCDDDNALVFPGNIEDCDDSFDNDCDAIVNETCDATWLDAPTDAVLQMASADAGGTERDVWLVTSELVYAMSGPDWTLRPIHEGTVDRLVVSDMVLAIAEGTVTLIADPSQSLAGSDLSVPAWTTGSFEGGAAIAEADATLFVGDIDGNGSTGQVLHKGSPLGDGEIVDEVLLVGTLQNEQTGYALATGDLNGDGTNDLAVSRGTANGVAVFYGPDFGPTTLDNDAALPFGATWLLDIVDVLDDGTPDVVAGITVGTGTVSVATAETKGGFAEVASIEGLENPSACVLPRGTGAPALVVGSGPDLGLIEAPAGTLTFADLELVATADNTDGNLGAYSAAVDSTTVLALDSIEGRSYLWPVR